MSWDHTAGPAPDPPSSPGSQSPAPKRDSFAGSAGVLSKTRPRGGQPSKKVELADLFVHCVPSSWRWFGCRMLQKVITAALHASNVAFSVSDLRGEDAPLVWISEGFVRVNGFARDEAIGRNCRFLQSDSSDFGAVHEMRRAVLAGQHTRVYLWNMPLEGSGFWSIISLTPGRGDDVASGTASDDDPRARYMMGVQYRLTKAQMRFVFDRVLAYRHSCWEKPRPPLAQERSADEAELPSARLTRSADEAELPSARLTRHPAGLTNPTPVPPLEVPASALRQSPSVVLETAASVDIPEKSTTAAANSHPHPQPDPQPSPQPDPDPSPQPEPEPDPHPQLERPAATSDVADALSAWRDEFVRRDGRQPSPDELTAMVLGVYARL